MSTTTETLDGLVDDLDELTYHALPGLSSTGAKAILRSPAHYRWQVEHRTDKAAFDLGHAAHADVLGTGLEVVRVEADDWRTKDARAARDAAYAAGKVPLLAKDADRAHDIAEAVRAHPIAAVLFTEGRPEVSAFWTDEATGVACRGRFDYLRRLNERPALIDLKTTVDANPKTFGNAVARFGYAIQQAHYSDGHRAITGEAPVVLFVLVETEPPHLVSVVQLDEDTAAAGHALARVARERYRDCVAADLWPGYSDEIEVVRAPIWYLRDAEDALYV